MITTEPESPRQPEIEEILRLSDEYAFSLYPPESCYLLDIAELETPDVTVFVSRDEMGTAHGMAAIVTRDDGSAELKRMFVLESARGMGVGSALMAAIESHARVADASRIVLETGPLQVAAIALYKRHGYEIIPNFGAYVGDEFSVCMAKGLVPA